MLDEKLQGLFSSMIPHKCDDEPASPVRRSAVGIGLLLLGSLIVGLFFAARVGLDRDPPRDLPGKIFCDVLIHGFALVGLALVSIGLAYSLALRSETVHWLGAQLVRKLVLFVVALLVVSTGVLIGYWLWPVSAA